MPDQEKKEEDAMLKRMAKALERTKKLSMGPSMELEDSIMVEVFEALSTYAAQKEGLSEKGTLWA